MDASMRWIIKIGACFLQILYYVYRAIPGKRRILIVSRQSDMPSIDIQMLCEALEKERPQEQVKVMCRYNQSAAKISLSYLFYMIGPMMWNFAHAKLVVLDGYCIVASMLKHRHDLPIVQMWHAMGAFKKFGYAVLDEKEGYSQSLAEAMHMHRGYHYVFVSQEICRPLMQQAYKCPLDALKVMPLPRVDFIRREPYVTQSRERIQKAYPQLVDTPKKVILYAPTFRKGGDNEDYIRRFAQAVDYTKYELIIKPHPLVHGGRADARSILDTQFQSIEWLAVADYVVTDYSAFILEAALADVPIYRFVPDAEDYLENRGFFIDISTEWPGYVSANAREVLSAMEQNMTKGSDVRAFAEKYVADSGHCTADMAAFLCDLL